MSDTNGQVAAQPAGAPAQTAAQPTQQFSPPAGYRTVSDSDFERYTRAEQQVKGFTPFYERAGKLGIKTAEDLDRWAPAIETFTKRKMDPRAFAASFSDEAERDLNGQGAQPQSIDIEKLKAEMRQESSVAAHEVNWNRAREGEDKFIESTLTKLIGDSPANEYEKETLRGALETYLWKNRGVYGEDQPLKGRVKEFTDELGAGALKHFSELKAKAAAATKGSEMADRATAANTPVKAKVGTVAGGGSSASGKPNTTELKGRNGMPSRAEAAAALELIQMRRRR